jgi:hypothetical protein
MLSTPGEMFSKASSVPLARPLWTFKFKLINRIIRGWEAQLRAKLVDVSIWRM